MGSKFAKKVFFESLLKNDITLIQNLKVQHFKHLIKHSTNPDIQISITNVALERSKMDRSLGYILLDSTRLITKKRESQIF